MMSAPPEQNQIHFMKTAILKILCVIIETHKQQIKKLDIRTYHATFILLTWTLHGFSSPAVLFSVRFASTMKVSEGVSGVLLNVDIAHRNQEQNDS